MANVSTYDRGSDFADIESLMVSVEEVYSARLSHLEEQLRIANKWIHQGEEKPDEPDTATGLRLIMREARRRLNDLEDHIEDEIYELQQRANPQPQ